MKKIALFTFSLWISIISLGQNLLSEKDAAYMAKTDSISVPKEFLNADGEVTKSEGDSAYIKNDFLSAIQIYESLLKKGEAADIYYNLGNSYYKAGEIAKAIVNYERALLLEPGNSDIRANLEIARSKTIDKVEPILEVFFVSWTKSIINSMSVDAWATCGIIFFIIFLVSLSFFIFSKKLMWKKTGFIGAILCIVIVVMANIFASEQKERLVNRDSAIVIGPSITVRSTPSESGTSLFVLHEGHKVSIKDNSMKEWKEIRLADGKVGWVPASAIEVI